MYLPPAQSSPPARIIDLGSGISAIDRFVAELNRFKRSPAEIPRVRGRALELVQDAAPNDEIGEIRRVWRFVRDAIRYVKDVRGVDTLQSPRMTLELLQGDCDDKALLLSSMLESIGYATRFAVSATVKHGTYNHVYVETFVPRLGRWMPLESSVPGFPFGRAIRSHEPLRRFA